MVEFGLDDLLGEVDSSLETQIELDEYKETGLNKELVDRFTDGVVKYHSEKIGLSNLERAMIEKQQTEGLTFDNETLVLYHYVTGCTIEDIVLRTGISKAQIQGIINRSSDDEMLRMLEERMANNTLITDVAKGYKYDFLEDIVLDKIYSVLDSIHSLDIEEGNGGKFLTDVAKIIIDRNKSRSDALAKLRDSEIKKLGLNLSEGNQTITLNVTESERDMLDEVMGNESI